MLSRLGARIASLFRATAPDPFVLAILLSGITFVLAWSHMGGGAANAEAVVNAWQSGLWDLLAFAMQMCLILVLGHALASTRPVAYLLRGLVGLPRSARQGVWLTATTAMSFALLNWGLGLIVGAVLARNMQDALSRRAREGHARCRVPAGLLPAAGYTGLMCWHGGFSGSAPLAAADPEALAKLLGPDLFARAGGAIPISQTLLTPTNLLISGGLLLFTPLLLSLLCSRDGSPDDTPAPSAPPPAIAEDPADRPGRLPRFLEQSPLVILLLVVPMALYLLWQFRAKGWNALDLNSVNLALLACGLALHASAARYAAAIDEAAKGCGAILVQFPLYAGIIAMLKYSGLIDALSNQFVEISGSEPPALRVLVLCSAAIVNLFVPSGGGQWAVQGPIAIQAALDAGADPGRLVLCVAYGDQLTNMIQPFWALPLLAITRARARDIVGYTAIAMLAGLLWCAACLALL